MNRGRKILMAVACCILVLSLSTAALALETKSKTFIEKNVGGKRVTCSGTISQDLATATLSSETIPWEPIMPDEAYVSHVWVAAFDIYDRRICGSDNDGSVNATTECKINSNTWYVHYTFDYQSERLGPFKLYY